MNKEKTLRNLTPGLRSVLQRYPELVSDHFRELILKAGSPIARQVLPHPDELSEANERLPEDPIEEDSYSPIPNLSHRYPDRVLFLISDRCPVFCRFCTRKRKVGRGLAVTDGTVNAGIRYIEANTGIRDVLLSGGDPLMLDPGPLQAILDRLRSIRHVEIIRIGTRVPSAMPERVTPGLAEILSAFQPIYVHVHFNHPAELTEPAREACRTLADAGIPLNGQTVLLRNVNDSTDTLEELFRSLLQTRVRPYYLFQSDLVRGTGHFRTPLMKGIRIMEELHLRTSPMALPAFAVDLPRGAGKVFPTASTVINQGTPAQAILMPNGTAFPYPDPD